jgi:hypothetical protein
MLSPAQKRLSACCKRAFISLDLSIFLFSDV